MKSRLSRLILLLNLLVTPLVWGVTVHSIQLDNLLSDEQINMADYKDQVILLNFFEPGCSWCVKQMKALHRLKQDCGNQVQPVSIGIHGQKQALKEVIYKSRINYPAGLASKQLQPLISTLNATPVTVIADRSGKPIYTMQGYISYEKLHSALESVCNVSNS